jgi:HK97 family phage prohead protease
MLRDHERDRVIGKWTDIAEDAKGLFVKGALTLDVQLARETRSLIKDGAMGGLSIGYGFEPGGFERDDKRPGVTRLTKIDLREISIVSMPMNLQARVTNIKSIIAAGELPTVREFENFLRESGGFSKALAAAIAGKAAPHLRGDPGAKSDETRAFLQKLLAQV